MAEEPKAPAGSGPEKAAAKPTAKPPAKPSDTPEPWADPLREALEKRFPSALTDQHFNPEPVIPLKRIEVINNLETLLAAGVVDRRNIRRVGVPGLVIIP